MGKCCRRDLPIVAYVQWHVYGGALKRRYVCEYHARYVRHDELTWLDEEAKVRDLEWRTAR